MSKSKKFHRRFTGINNEMLESVIWQSLNHTAKCAYISILYNYRPDDNYIVCARKKAVCPMSSGPWTRAIRELQEKGFIQIIHSGGFGKNPNRYILSDSWKFIP